MRKQLLSAFLVLTCLMTKAQTSSITPDSCTYAEMKGGIKINTFDKKLADGLKKEFADSIEKITEYFHAPHHWTIYFKKDASEKIYDFYQKHTHSH